MLGRAFDKLVGVFSPHAALSRMEARSSLEAIQNLFGNQNGYDATKLGRLNQLFQQLNENSVGIEELRSMDANAQDLWRNNPHARKIVRQIQTKVIGNGMRPISQAVHPDGEPHLEFRKRALEIWRRFVECSDSRGKPGRGGQHFTDQAKTALAAVVRSGNVLYRMRRLTVAQMAKRGLNLPMQCQLISGARLDANRDQQSDPEIKRGIELNDDGTVAAYYLLEKHPSEFMTKVQSVRYSADDIRHCFVSDDIDQHYGVSWFAPILLPSRDVNDYTYNELKAAVLSSCIVMGIKGMSGNRNPLNQQRANLDTADDDGNTITRMRPGMVVNLPSTGDLVGFDPKRPNTNAIEFLQHLQRTMALGVPGIKGTSLTGDFRGSSFSSEKSAENEAWPEIEAIQQWWSGAFYQPTYEDVIRLAVVLGMFSGVITESEFTARQNDLLACRWQGPVGQSINPKDDRTASRLGMRNLQTSAQIESARVGHETVEVLQHIQDTINQIERMPIGDEWKDILIRNALGVDIATTDSVDEAPKGEGGKDDEGSDSKSGDRMNRLSEVLYASE